jgi:Holliday junction resolvase-like predicted endonuclease
MRKPWRSPGFSLVPAKVGVRVAFAMARDTSRMINALYQGGPTRLASYLAACFTGETPIYAKRGWIRFDELTDQDEVLARPENDPNGLQEFKRVEEVFRTIAPIWHLHVGGQVIRTTSEHPFWVRGKGWVAAQELQEGDLLSSHDGKWIAIEECMDAGYAEAVYNCRVAEFATYFVGDFAHWGFDLWAHNLCSPRMITGASGEQLARRWLRANGYRVMGSIKNPSGHGIDIVARDSNNRLVFFEVKTSNGLTAPALSYDQSLGAEYFVKTRLQRAAAGTGAWAAEDARTQQYAERLIEEVGRTGGWSSISGGVFRITNLSTGPVLTPPVTW